jgi:hypothetical protein
MRATDSIARAGTLSRGPTVPQSRGARPWTQATNLAMRLRSEARQRIPLGDATTKTAEIRGHLRVAFCFARSVFGLCACSCAHVHTFADERTGPHCGPLKPDLRSVTQSSTLQPPSHFVRVRIARHALLSVPAFSHSKRTLTQKKNRAP